LIAHGDDHGIVLPPKTAPIQVVIVPVFYKGKEEHINKTCEDGATKLKEAKLRVELDSRKDLTPGDKFYYWELRGVPIRIEIGPRDVEKGEATVVRRDTLEKQTCKLDELVAFIQKIAEQMMKDLRQKAWQWMKDHVYRVTDLSEVRRLLQKRAGIVEVFWCGKAECGRELEHEVNARVLGVPEDVMEKVDGKCVVCRQKASSVVRVALAY